MEEKLTDFSRQMRKRKAKRCRAPFFAGPIPLAWLSRACRLGGKALHVALAVQHRLKVSGQTVASITPKLLETFKVPTGAAYRALDRLESAGLVKVNRRRGRNPRVTVQEIHEKQEVNE